MNILKRPKIEQVLKLPTDCIDPNASQPRTTFNNDELESLAQSIKQNGLLQPITVRKSSGGSRYELISGERRLRACKSLGMPTIRAIVVEADDSSSAILATVENLRREDLSFFDEARGLYELLSRMGITQEVAAAKLGMAQSTLANKLRILRLPPSIQNAVQEHGLTERHARALLRLPTPEQQQAVLLNVVKKRLNVTQTERYIEEIIAVRPKPAKRILVVKDLRIFINTIDRAIDTMKQAGIEAEASQSDRTDYIEYIVKIPKNSVYQHASRL